MLQSDADSLAQLIEHRLGLARNRVLHSNLPAILDEIAPDGPADLLRSLQRAPETSEAWQRLIRALLIGETYFFRSRVHLDILRSTILPDVLARSPEPVLWNPGCATGEETYSLAITLQETLPRFQLLGTDVNRAALELAERGIYRPWAFRHTTADFQQTYFCPVEDGWQIVPRLRDAVRFRWRNLLSGSPLRQVDVIVCSNVLLYFSEEAARRAEEVFFNALAPGGWLILGQSESLRADRAQWVTHLFSGAVVYQKAAPTLEPSRTVYHALNPRSSAPAEEVLVGDALYVRAVEAVRLKRYADAEHLLASLILDKGQDARPHVLRGCIYANLGQPDRAREELAAALRLNPLMADAYYLKAMLDLEDGDETRALTSLRSALYCQPGHPLAGLILGHLHLGQGDRLSARRIWRDVLDALESLPLDAPVSDVSDWTAVSLRDFLLVQLDSLRAHPL
jgi:chemotaxis protein methyltransferase CheR